MYSKVLPVPAQWLVQQDVPSLNKDVPTHLSPYGSKSSWMQRMTTENPGVPLAQHMSGI